MIVKVKRKWLCPRALQHLKNQPNMRRTADRNLLKYFHGEVIVVDNWALDNKLQIKYSTACQDFAHIIFKSLKFHVDLNIQLSLQVSLYCNNF